MICFVRTVMVAAFMMFFGIATSADDAIATPPANVILERITLAKEICERQTPSFTTEVVITEHKRAVWKKVKGKKKPQKVWRITKERSEAVIERPVVLCAWSEQEHSWHVIHVHVPYPQHDPFSYVLKTEGYRLEHVSGTGVARLIFNAYRVTPHGEEKLVVYRYLHSWFSPESLAKGNGPHLLLDARFVSYTPSIPELENTEMLAVGMHYLYGELMEVYQELHDSGEASKAFPSKLLADVIDWRIPFALAANEQMDHDKFNADEWGTTASVYNEFALNGPETFMWSFSNFNYKGRKEHAVGVMQFTNHLGTYDSVLRACPRVHIDPYFLRGAQQLKNSLKAAICLLDIELARLPLEARLLYQSNPAIGGVYPVIAYNAGPAKAKSAYEAITANGIDLEKADLGLPEQVFIRKFRCTTCKKERRHGTALRVLPEETEMYVKKYIYVLEFIDQLHPELPLPPTQEKTP